MATIDQQFVEYIVKTLVKNPEKVVVERQIDEKGVLLSLTVDPEDVGRVIGRRGATAQAIRVLLRALGTKQDARYNLKIVDLGEGGHAKGEDAEESDHDDDSRDDDDKSDEDVAEKEDAEVEEEDDEEDDEEDEEEDEEDEDEDTDSSELAEKTRAELADLDDLDI